MTAIGDSALGVYLFSRKGATLLATPTAGELPLDPAQVEGVLALAGGFADRRQDGVLRVQYDGLGIVGLRGETTVAVLVSREGSDLNLLPELERFLRRCDRRLRRQRR